MIEPVAKQRRIEVCGFKWPKRPTTVTMAKLLGEDEFGRWLGVARGEPWWAADRSCRGQMGHTLVKLIPNDTFWSCCFHSGDPIVDVDIILPVKWENDVLEEVDLELDILRFKDGRVEVRDQDEFARVRARWAMPDDIVMQANATCEQIYGQVQHSVEPFGDRGRAWLRSFMETIQ